MNQSSEIFDCIKEEYLSGKGGYRKLAKEHGVPRRLVAERWKDENWQALRFGIHTEEKQHDEKSLGCNDAETSTGFCGGVLKDLSTEENQHDEKSLDCEKSFERILQYRINDCLALFLKEIIEDEELRRSFLPSCKELKDYAAVLKESEQMKRRELGTDSAENSGTKGGIVFLPAVTEIPETEALAV